MESESVWLQMTNPSTNSSQIIVGKLNKQNLQTMVKSSDNYNNSWVTFQMENMLEKKEMQNDKILSFSSKIYLVYKSIHDVISI